MTHLVDLTTLPKGWTQTTVGKVINNISLTGRKLKQRQYEKKGLLPVIDQGQDFIGGYTNLEELRISAGTPIIVFGDTLKL